MNLNRMGHFLQNETTDGGEGGGQQQQASSTEGQQQGGNLLNQGVSNDFIPEKYRVNGADGSLDMAASSRKLAEAYGSLEKRLGGGDVPPKTVDEYAPRIEVEGFDFNEFKQDESAQAFLKGAHAKGLTNAQVEYVLGEYLKAAPELLRGAAQLDQQGATEALKGVWKTDAEFKGGVRDSYRAVQGFAAQGDGIGSFDNLMTKYGNDPDFIAFTAAIGREMSEDRPAQGDPIADSDFETQAAELRRQLEATPTEDPRRRGLQDQLTALYNRKYPSGAPRPFK